MARLNVARIATGQRTHEGAPAHAITPASELRRSVLSCLLWEDEFYESGTAIAARIAALVPAVAPATVAALAVEARTAMKLRHAPLLLVREMARHPSHRGLVARLLPQVVQRADELAEFLTLYWAERAPGDRRRPPLAAQVKKGLAAAFGRFDAYQLGKYDRAGPVALRDVLRLVHPLPANDDQAALWRRLIDGTLETPDTWETALSGGADKKASFERLIAGRKLGALALLRNLRGMLEAGVDADLIREALAHLDVGRVLPFRFLAAARHAPLLEPELERALFRCLSGAAKLPGTTVLLVDVSGSMDSALSRRSQTTRLEAAAGLAILARELCERAVVLTFSDRTVGVPARRGFALRDAIVASQPHSGTLLGEAVRSAAAHRADRLIVLTDEQSHDAVPAPPARGYLVNIASARHGVGYGSWVHVDGFSEAALTWIGAFERDAAF